MTHAIRCNLYVETTFSAILSKYQNRPDQSQFEIRNRQRLLHRYIPFGKSCSKRC